MTRISASPKHLRIGCLTACLLLFSAPALADDKKDGEVDKLLEEGVIQYGLADFETSVDKLKLALQGAKSPDTLAKIHLFLGANYMDMGQQEQAEAAFLQALKHNPVLKLPEEFKSTQKTAFEKVRDGARGELRVGSNIKTRVMVGGKPVGKTPYRGKLPIGSHVVSIQGPKGKWKTETVILFPERESRIRANFKVAARPKKPRPARGEKSGRLWTWIAAGTAVAVAGAGLGFWFAGESDYSEWEDLQVDEATAKANDERLTDLEDSIRAKELGAYISFGVAGAVAVTSIVLFFLEGKPGRQERRASGLLQLGNVEISPVLGRRSGLSLTARF